MAYAPGLAFVLSAMYGKDVAVFHACAATSDQLCTRFLAGGEGWGQVSEATDEREDVLQWSGRLLKEVCCCAQRLSCGGRKA